MSRRRGQSMTEFAIIAPLLLLFVFGIVDVARATYTFTALASAVNQAARAATVGGSIDYPPARNDQVLAAVHATTAGLDLRLASCPNGPITGDPAPDTGLLWITAPGGTGTPNAPGGEAPLPGSPGCAAIVPAGGNQPLTITGRFRVKLVTPVLSQLLGGSILLQAHATTTTDY